MARPRKKIDPILVEKLAAIHCTITEIASVCDCSVDTLERRFADIIEKGKSKGKTKLRQGLWELASKGNLGALIWLSKQHLDMTDKTETIGDTMPKEIKLHWADENERISNDSSKK